MWFNINCPYCIWIQLDLNVSGDCACCLGMCHLCSDRVHLLDRVSIYSSEAINLLDIQSSSSVMPNYCIFHLSGYEHNMFERQINDLTDKNMLNNRIDVVIKRRSE